MKNVVVSVICNTYNHGKYIRETLEGFVMQKTDFTFEVLIHDDASTDNTADIIREYEARYPELIKPIYQKENQYSQHISIEFAHQYPRVKGKYVAVCEGDDYWIDPYKLQKQVDALESHPGVDCCAHSVHRVLANTGEVIAAFGPPVTEDTVLSTEQVIKGGGGFVATNSVMYRSELNRNIPPFRQMLNLDYTVQIHGALRGGMLYLKDTMACYRCQAEGSWTSRMSGNANRRINSVCTVIEMLRQLDEDTDHLYHEIIEEKRRSNEFYILRMQGNYAAMRKAPYRQLYRQLSLRRKLGLAVREFTPWLYKLLRKS